MQQRMWSFCGTVPFLFRLIDNLFDRTLHHALFNIDIVSGAFICPESGREFPIVGALLYELLLWIMFTALNTLLSGGVPNMILFETEVRLFSIYAFAISDPYGRLGSRTGQTAMSLRVSLMTWSM
jgi:hypothetical protein